MARSVLALARSAPSWGLFPAILGIAVGTSYWLWAHPRRARALLEGRLAQQERVDVLHDVAATLGILALTIVTGVVILRLRRGRWIVVPTLRQINRRLYWVLALPVALVFQRVHIERAAPLETLALALIGAAGIAASVYGVRSRGCRAKHRRRWARWTRQAAPLGVLALGVAYAWFFSRLAIVNHHALNTRTFDLGLYDNIFWHSSHGRPLGCSFLRGGTHASGHFDPLLVLLSPLYRLHPRAELLLVLQSIWLATGVAPLYLMAQEVTGRRWVGLALALAYVLYPAMHGANMYEFHSLTLVTPLLLWAVFALEAKRWWLFGASVVLCWLTREDIPLLLCFVGLAAVLRGEGRARAGGLTIVLSVAYFVVVKAFFMASPAILNDGPGAYGFSNYFRDMIPHGDGVRGLVTTVVTHPWLALKHAFTNERKWVFLLVLFAPLGFLPLLARGARIMLLFGVAIVLLASYPPVFSPTFQYSSWVFPLAFAATPIALRQIEDGESWVARLGLDPQRLVRALVAFIVSASVLVTWKFGGLVRNAAFRGGPLPVARELVGEDAARYGALERMVRRIPPGASLTVTNRVGPHASNRAEVYLYAQRRPTDFVLSHDRDFRVRARQYWHDERIRAGGLKLVDSHGPIKLFEVDPSRDVPWSEALRRFRAIREKELQTR